jgi:hypothetical protein
MKRFARVGITVGAAVGMLVAMALPASAGGFPITLQCGDTTYNVIVNGNGDWAPARDTDSTLVFHPTAFGTFTGTFTPSDGGPPQTETDPPFARKNQPRNGRPTLDCTYHFTDTDSSGTFEGGGDVSGWTSGTRNN